MILEKVEKLCKERGVSISKLEKECNIGNGTISRWDESLPRLVTIQKVAKYFDVPIEHFLE